MTLAKAIRIAALKHGQSTDKGGMPFIGHPLRVMAGVAAKYADADDEILAAAVLHDVLEDTGTDAMELVTEGMTEKTVRLVGILTHNDAEGYFDYIDRVAVGRCFGEERGNRPFYAMWAVRLKLCDLADNLNPARRIEGAKLPERYQKAVEMLCNPKVTHE